jgi:hypothetical protein
MELCIEKMSSVELISFCDDGISMTLFWYHIFSTHILKHTYVYKLFCGTANYFSVRMKIHVYTIRTDLLSYE